MANLPANWNFPGSPSGEWGPHERPVSAGRPHERENEFLGFSGVHRAPTSNVIAPRSQQDDRILLVERQPPRPITTLCPASRRVKTSALHRRPMLKAPALYVA